MSQEKSKRELFEQIAGVGRALASGPRIAMLDLLAQGERSVEQLAEAAQLSVANASQHLQVLRRAGLVATQREGAQRALPARRGDIVALWLSLRDVATERVADVERAARDYLGDELEAIGRAELAERLGSGEVVVVDVRPRVEFAAGHIQGARSVPLDEPEARLAEIPDGAEVVAYCRGPDCVYAHEAVRRLQAAGRRARRLEDGLPEWRLAGLPHESAATPEARSRVVVTSS